VTGEAHDVVVENLTIDYGAVRAVADVSFEIKPGELVTLLGPSGCGKTSTLRAIAGLERNSGGRILIGGAAVSDAAKKRFLPPERRDIGMVFQSYALWPHMTVAEAVGYPLRRRAVAPLERAERVTKALATVGMEPFEHRRVPELSGGQQQRVAIARALVYEPRILLLDEPLSNLDARLRERMRAEIKELQSRLGITTLYVTHDQVEALSMSHRIIVMQAGRIEQIGTPEELYENPRTRFVSESLGRVNLLPARVTYREVSGRSKDGVRVELEGTGIVLEASTMHEGVREGDRLLLTIRPARVELLSLQQARGEGRGEGVNTVEGIVESCMFGGDHRQYYVAFKTHGVTVKADARVVLREGESVHVHLPAGDLWAVPGDHDSAMPALTD
jgi:iron(III) transport system ATP-binding protein